MICIPTFTYDQAVLLLCIKPDASYPDELCFGYIRHDCPAFSGTADYDACQFIIPYASSYDTSSHHVRADMRAQFPPERYPELYV